MITTLSILNGSGDETIEWDHSKRAQIKKARKRVAELAAAGFQFFLVDGTTPADAIEAGRGKLLAKKLTPAEMTEETPAEGTAEGTAKETERQTVAVPILRGG